MYVCSKKILEIQFISEFTGERCELLPRFCPQTGQLFAGWGRKASFFRAQRYAKKYATSAICLEDGFIRSLGLGKEGYPPLSLVVDESGIYFDATQSSDLEKLIQQPENQQDIFRAKRAIQQILDCGITKYNQKFSQLDKHHFSQGRHILVVDQTFGDQSVKYAGANQSSFQHMLSVAIAEHPEATIWIKIHPDVVAGKAKGYFDLESISCKNVRICSENYNPIELLKHVNDVYVVSSQLGFEALLCGKTVHCFGVPWYAGWGLTQDQYAPIHILKGRRQKQKSLEHLFVCAYLNYARYVSPVTQQRCELEQILEILIPNIEFQKRYGGSIYAYGFTPWKRQFLADFLKFPQITLEFRKWFLPKKSCAVMAWGKKSNQLKDMNTYKVSTIEDGFIRSVGLGAELIRPYSLVFDDIGIYYDATRPSRLENLLNHHLLSDKEILRVKKLIQNLIELQISKYNVGTVETIDFSSKSVKVRLVVGQVEDDMSIQLGGVDIKNNLELLKVVRDQFPDDYIIYKPHPDVHAGLRLGYIKDSIILQYANQIETTASILECFKICDSVHTISSLSGFEALLRGIDVYCYGLPFYSGWGLTVDRHCCVRRNKKITLEQLAYVTLVEYPCYNIPVTRAMGIPLVTPELVIQYIEIAKQQPKLQHKSKFSQMLRIFRQIRLGKYQ